MRFTDLISLLRARDLDDQGAHGRRPPRDHVREVQHALTAMLADEDFYLDCVELELAAVLRRTPERPAAPMFRMRDRAHHVRMFYWWPGKAAPPHEHTAWTVTAVFYNALEVTTFDFDVAYRERRLERKHVFAAEQGAAGHIFDRCIHFPANRGAKLAASIHIFNATDEPRIEREVGPIAGMGSPTGRFVRGPDETERLHAIKQRQMRALAQMVGQFRSERAQQILRVIASSGDQLTQSMADRIAWSISRGEGNAVPDVRIENG
jgi:predicted metal-dependent enzyme (double-stranded beta helix superfamily)